MTKVAILCQFWRTQAPAFIPCMEYLGRSTASTYFSRIEKNLRKIQFSKWDRRGLRSLRSLLLRRLLTNSLQTLPLKLSIYLGDLRIFKNVPNKILARTVEVLNFIVCFILRFFWKPFLALTKCFLRKRWNDYYIPLCP